VREGHPEETPFLARPRTPLSLISSALTLRRKGTIPVPMPQFVLGTLGRDKGHQGESEHLLTDFPSGGESYLPSNEPLSTCFLRVRIGAADKGDRTLVVPIVLPTHFHSFLIPPPIKSTLGSGIPDGHQQVLKKLVLSAKTQTFL